MEKLTREWVRKAEGDISAARTLFQSKPRVNNAICFHCQQAMEKYMKSLLQETGMVIPKIHDLGDLLDVLLPVYPGLSSLRKDLDLLTDFAVDYRYPGMNATSRESRMALQKSERMRQEFRSTLGLAS